jgi:hypothetical protein
MLAGLTQKIDRHAKNQHIPEIANKMRHFQDQIEHMKAAIADIKEKGGLSYV